MVWLEISYLRYLVIRSTLFLHNRNQRTHGAKIASWSGNILCLSLFEMGETSKNTCFPHSTFHSFSPSNSFENCSYFNSIFKYFTFSIECIFFCIFDTFSLSRHLLLRSVSTHPPSERPITSQRLSDWNLQSFRFYHHRHHHCNHRQPSRLPLTDHHTPYWHAVVHWHSIANCCYCTDSSRLFINNHWDPFPFHIRGSMRWLWHSGYEGRFDRFVACW